MKKSRNDNGEGSIYFTIEKHKRKKFLEHECNICKNCTDRKDCDNRIGYKKCKKCEDCNTECLNYCDRFYVYEKYRGQITVNGKSVTVSNKRNKKEAIIKKKEKEAEFITGNYIEKNDITLLELAKKRKRKKEKANLLSDNTILRDSYDYAIIEKSPFSSKPIQKINYEEINDFLNICAEMYSQSQINKLAMIIINAYEQAHIDNIIKDSSKILENIIIPHSQQTKKEVIAFSLDEQKTLIKYLLTHRNLIRSSKYEQETIVNIILIALLSLARIGEIGALYIEDINFEDEYIIIERTLTSDRNNNTVIGKSTKTGKVKEEIGLIDKRQIDFDIFNKELFLAILKQQVKISENNPNNKKHLLFCKKDGSYINRTNITSFIKKICRDAGIKLELPKGCHIHMTRHTGITRMIEFGYDLFFIICYSGHTGIREIERTYGHILADFRKRKAKNPTWHYTKEDLIDEEIMQLAREYYKS